MNNNFALPQNCKFLLGQFLGLQEFLQAETAKNTTSEIEMKCYTCQGVFGASENSSL
jgi:hypothetical protein